MPKDEFDFEDPFELNAMAFLTDKDTTNDMAECFIEEFMRMGYNHKQVLALFRSPHYLGPNLAWQKRGEPFIRELIGDAFAKWGRSTAWDNDVPEHFPAEPAAPAELGETAEATPVDPLGMAVPKLNA